LERSFCFMQGDIRDGLIQYFDAARVYAAKNAATIIAEGAAWIAHDGIRVIPTVDHMVTRSRVLHPQLSGHTSPRACHSALSRVKP